jgi:CheY-like chemotaxis protein
LSRVVHANKASPRRVLVVEDDADAREIMVIYLRGHGWDVHEADSVGQALGMLRDARPSHVLLDLMLPDAGGDVLLRSLREQNLPVRVALTTAAGPNSRAVANTMPWNPDAVFHKPIALASIASWLTET